MWQISAICLSTGAKVLEENEEEDVVEVLQAAGESLGKLKEKHGLVSEYNEWVLELEGKIKINKRV